MAAASCLALTVTATVSSHPVRVHHPDAGSWKRTPCGSPSGSADIPSSWGKTVNPTVAGSILPEYPRPMLVRGSNGVALADHSSYRSLRDSGDPNTWTNLNGIWEFEPAPAGPSNPPIGKTLASTILVPFPVESCLSGVGLKGSADIVKQMWYRLTFDGSTLVRSDDMNAVLHFGAVDWQTSVWLNGLHLGNHTGGYDGFSFDVTKALRLRGPATPSDELLVYVYDPSDSGAQPNGKQRISALDRPGGDTYTPSSGIWQTVWLESMPVSHISSLQIGADTRKLTVTTTVEGSKDPVQYEVSLKGTVVAKGNGTGSVTILVPNPMLWSPQSPTLYDLKATVGGDQVLAYFGMRDFVLANESGIVRPHLNGKFTFMAGWLDQSWWPDGQYTAPTDDALKSDIIAAKTFGMNMVRLHQKVNSERWYYHADTVGVAIFQDAVQKYGHASNATIPFFVHDITAMIMGRGNHPSILQWETFNEADCWSVFNAPPYDVPGIVSLARKLDWQNRLVDTDSGGGANKQPEGDVNDIHSYPWPGKPAPTPTKYAMIGEFGGIGAFVEGKEWKPRSCHTYLHVNTPAAEADTYIRMVAQIKAEKNKVSASVYTQITDVELECDGFLNYDRSNKFDTNQTNAIMTANQNLINT